MIPPKPSRKEDWNSMRMLSAITMIMNMKEAAITTVMEHTTAVIEKKC